MHFERLNVLGERSGASRAGIKVLHYVGRYKPWLVAKTDPADPATIYADIWNSYVSSMIDLVAIPSADDRSRDKSFTEHVSDYLSDLNRRRKAWMGRMVGTTKYIQRADATEFFNNLLPQIHMRMLEKFRETEKEKQHRKEHYFAKDRRVDCNWCKE